MLTVLQKKQLAQQVIEAVANGGTVDKTLEDMGKPMAPNTFRATVLKDKDLLRAWEAAKEMRAHCMFDQAVDLTNELKNGKWGKEDSAMVRALDRAITAFFYAAARLAPREYGERPDKQVVVPIQINTSLNLGQDGAPRKETSIYHIRATAVDADHEPSGADSGRSVESPVVALPSQVSE